MGLVSGGEGHCGICWLGGVCVAVYGRWDKTGIKLGCIYGRMWLTISMRLVK